MKTTILQDIYPLARKINKRAFLCSYFFLTNNTCIEFMNTVEKYISKMELSSYLKHGKVLNQT